MDLRELQFQARGVYKAYMVRLHITYTYLYTYIHTIHDWEYCRIYVIGGLYEGYIWPRRQRG